MRPNPANRPGFSKGLPFVFNVHWPKDTKGTKKQVVDELDVHVSIDCITIYPPPKFKK